MNTADFLNESSIAPGYTFVKTGTRRYRKTWWNRLIVLQVQIKCVENGEITWRDADYNDLAFAQQAEWFDDGRPPRG